MKKGMKLYSVIKGVCPCCHCESMYRNKNAYRLSKTLEMYECCGHCGTKYKIEPSFFYGAMYVSYAVGVAIAMAIFISSLLFPLSLLTRFIVIVVVLVLLMPVIMRLSRNIWINIFLHYNKKK